MSASFCKKNEAKLGIALFSCVAELSIVTASSIKGCSIWSVEESSRAISSGDLAHASSGIYPLLNNHTYTKNGIQTAITGHVCPHTHISKSSRSSPTSRTHSKNNK